MSRVCGFARGKWLRLRADNDDENSRNSDENDADDDDTGLIFELSASPENLRTINATDAMEPLIAAGTNMSKVNLRVV
eukprot:CAMPEP_0198268974 /NCGR_PEP_ID=MMETSP1447-20131203/39567_1 /TAXON_ID=420782 /ORGANISM="Chaetoceros dichaeta, Strain CCMP1751" /LENGTH=77 /DNA_ID=CAMNT_0043960311 /DNA_START=632 /DNA_END=865 /DNA_ORIENTATION=-